MPFSSHQEIFQSPKAVSEPFEFPVPNWLKNIGEVAFVYAYIGVRAKYGGEGGRGGGGGLVGEGGWSPPPRNFGQLTFFGQQDKIWAKPVFKDVSMFFF